MANTINLHSAKPREQWKKRQLVRRRNVRQHLLDGMPIRDIADRVGVTLKTVKGDIQAIEADWLRHYDRSMTAQLHQELEQISQLQTAAWLAWERSREDTSTATRSERDGDVMTSVTTKENIGDPRFLAQVERCIEKRLQIYDRINKSKNEPDTAGDDMSHMIAEMVKAVRAGFMTAAQIYAYMGRQTGDEVMIAAGMDVLPAGDVPALPAPSPDNLP